MENNKELLEATVKGLQDKIDLMTTQKALSHSNQYRYK